MVLYKLCSYCNSKHEYGNKCKNGCMDKIKRERSREYDKNVRNSQDNIKYVNFYNSSSWKRMTEHIKRKYNGLCLMCLLREDKITTCDVVHHIKEIKSNWEDRLREDNLITLCHSCHNSLHNNYTEDKVIMLYGLVKEYEERYGI